MAHAGQVLDNPISGERMTFLKTAADTGGELLAIDFELLPNGHVPGAHVHPIQEERFEIVKGTMKFLRGLKTITARAGDTVVAPPKMVHRFENADQSAAHVHVEVRPAEDGRAVRSRGCHRPGGADDERWHAASARPRAVHARVRLRGQGSVCAGRRQASGDGAARLAGPAPEPQSPVPGGGVARTPLEA